MASSYCQETICSTIFDSSSLHAFLGRPEMGKTVPDEVVGRPTYGTFSPHFFCKWKGIEDLELESRNYKHWMKMLPAFFHYLKLQPKNEITFDTFCILCSRPDKGRVVQYVAGYNFASFRSARSRNRPPAGLQAQHNSTHHV